MKEMEKIDYRGATYSYIGGKWVDSKFFVVCDSMQRELNESYVQKIDLEKLELNEIIKLADYFKQSTSYELAIRLYEYVTELADKRTLAYILPRITSCYRKANYPKKAIILLTIANKKFGPDMVTPALLVSIAAAYCDLGDYKRALACCKRAQAGMGNTLHDELRLVYDRIHKEMNNR